MNSIHLRPSAATPGARPVLLLLLLAYVVLGLLFSVAFPLGEGPDEPAHFDYVRTLALQQRLPVLQVRRESSATTEAHQPPLYYAVGALLSFPWLEQDPPLVYRPNEDGSRPSFFRHSPAAAFPWRGGALAWHLLRLYSLSLGIVTLLATFGAARLVTGCGWTALAAVTYLALSPQFLYHNSLVTNDAAAAAAGSMLVLLTVRTVADAERFPWVWAGLLAAVALLSKMNAPLVAAGMVVAAHRHAGVRRLRWIELWKPIAATLLLACLLSGWWLLRNQLTYGDWTATARVVEAYPENHYEERLGWIEMIGVLPDMAVSTLRTSWGAFGWARVELPKRVFNVVAVVHLVVWLAALPTFWSRRRYGAALLLSVAALLAGFLWFNSLTNHSGWQGRLLFPGASIAAIVFATGWSRLAGSRAAAGFVCLVAAQLVLLAYCWTSIIHPTFWSAMP